MKLQQLNNSEKYVAHRYPQVHIIYGTFPFQVY